MKKNTKLTFLCIGAVMLLFCIPLFGRGETVAKGNIIGFVYGEDGVTPIKGAVVTIKNISTGTEYESIKSDENGVFTIEGVENGFYVCAVMTAQGEYSSESYFGLRVSDGETAKLSIALTPYEHKVAAALQEVYEGKSISGESLVGTVIEYDPKASVAEVLIVKGLLQQNDRIHAKGDETDFYQNVKNLKSGPAPVKRLFAGQRGSLKVNRSVKNGDLIYLVCKRAFPIGIPLIIAGSAGVIVQINNSYNQAYTAGSKYRVKK